MRSKTPQKSQSPAGTGLKAAKHRTDNAILMTYRSLSNARFWTVDPCGCVVFADSLRTVVAAALLAKGAV